MPADKSSENNCSNIAYYSADEWLNSVKQGINSVYFNQNYIAYRKINCDRPDIHGSGIHSIADNILFFVSDGSSEITADGKKIKLTPGTLFWLSPGVPHYITLRRGMKIFIMLFRVKNGSSNIGLAGKVVLQRDAWYLEQYVKAIGNEFLIKKNFHDIKLYSLFLSMVTEIFRHNTSDKGRIFILNENQQNRLIMYTRENIISRPSPSELAAFMNLTPDYFARIFKRTFGISPKTWLLQERIKAAAFRLLESTKKISEIAEEFGYSDVYLFTRQFTLINGHSPNRYRKRFSTRLLL